MGDDGAMSDACPYCGKKTKLNRYSIFVSVWSTPAKKTICENCAKALRERHIYVVPDDGEEELQWSKAELRTS